MGTIGLNLATVSTRKSGSSHDSIVQHSLSELFLFLKRYAFLLVLTGSRSLVLSNRDMRHGSRAVRERHSLFNIRFSFLACVSFLHLYLPSLRKWQVVRHVTFFSPDHSSDIFSSMLPLLPNPGET